MRKIQRTTITYARSNAQGNGRGDKLSEVKDELSSPMLPLLELQDLKPGEGITVRVHFYRPLETSPGSKLYEAMSEHADGIRAGMIGGDDWGDLSAETRELFERAAMAVHPPRGSQEALQVSALLSRLRKLQHRFPPMYAVHATDDCHMWPDEGPPGDNHSSTVSPEKGAHGWTNDNGCSGYGLPEEVADYLAELTQLLPEIIARLEKQ